MQEHKGFSLETVRRANIDMMLGVKPEVRISDKFTREDIERAWREAYASLLCQKESHEAF